MATRIIAPPGFWSHVDKGSHAPCWTWKGSITKEGYGVAHGLARAEYAHRVAYSELIGPIASDLHIDHLCRRRDCCNPAHLEAVTCQENVLRSPVAPAAINARKTHCDKGHEFTTSNTRVEAGSVRVCRACSRARAAQVTAQRKADRHRENAAAVRAAGGACLHRSKRGNICTRPKGHDGIHRSIYPLTEVQA